MGYLFISVVRDQPNIQKICRLSCLPSSLVFVGFFHRDPVPKAEEGAVTPGGPGSGRMRFFSMKRTSSQHSFDTTSVDGSGPEDGLSVDSDGSDGFVMLTDSGKALGFSSPHPHLTGVIALCHRQHIHAVFLWNHFCCSLFLNLLRSCLTVALSAFVGAFCLRQGG